MPGQLLDAYLAMLGAKLATLGAKFAILGAMLAANGRIWQASWLTEGQGRAAKQACKAKIPWNPKTLGKIYG